jgi:hypothetical protein
MNDLIKNISDISVENTKKTHRLLDAVLFIISRDFKDNEITFNQQRSIFEVDINNLHCVIVRDLNRFFVNIRFVNEGNVIAECTTDIGGGFEETYGKITNKDIKIMIANLFSDIANIDVAYVINNEEPEEPVEVVEPAETVESTDDIISIDTENVSTENTTEEE